MLSRIADSLFWMARYLERTDGILRMLKINFITSLDQSGQEEFNWLPVLQLFSPLSKEEAEKLAPHSDEVLRYMIFSKENENSIRCIVGKARENARGVQDHITKEVWECINEFHLALSRPELEKSIDKGEQILMLGELINHYLLFNGTAEVTMPRELGWDFMNLGKFIERGLITADILDTKFNDIAFDLDNPGDLLYWRNLLLSLSGYELYLKRYHGGLYGVNVVDMGILNPQFPRSLAYCMFRLDRIIQNQPEDLMETDEPLKKIIGRMRSKVEFGDIQTISRVGLHYYLNDLKNDLYQFSNSLGRNYFSYN
jgi:uncharacterized alpha-E superfamily protein